MMKTLAGFVAGYCASYMAHTEEGQKMLHSLLKKSATEGGAIPHEIISAIGHEAETEKIASPDHETEPHGPSAHGVSHISGRP
jgi:hypothetical protein